MGLDMYLYRMPRHKNVTANMISAIESYFSWVKAKEEGNKYANCTFEEWCGHNFDELPDIETIEFFRPLYVTRYCHWDTEKKYGHAAIKEEVGYWRKANQIHNWFVENVQNGEDDCEYHHEVTKETLELLLKICKLVLKSCKLVDGKISNGYKYENGKRIPIMQDGKYVKDPSIAEQLLPSTAGFFFGGTDYDEYYVRDIKDTIEIITKVLETTDFEKQMIYYVSSW